MTWKEIKDRIEEDLKDDAVIDYIDIDFVMSDNKKILVCQHTNGNWRVTNED